MDVLALENGLNLLEENRTLVFLSSPFRTSARPTDDRSRLRLDLICTKSSFGDETLDHWINKGVFVTARLPNGAIHQNRSIHADDVVALVHHHSPPIIFQVALQLHAKRAVIPAAVQAAVNFARLENKATP